MQKLKSAVSRIEMENADIREKLRASEQRETLLDDSKARLEAELSAAKKNTSEKHMEIEVRRTRGELPNFHNHSSFFSSFHCTKRMVLKHLKEKKRKRVEAL